MLLYCLIIDLKAYNKITQLRNGTPFHKSRFFPLQFEVQDGSSLNFSAKKKLSQRLTRVMKESSCFKLNSERNEFTVIQPLAKLKRCCLL